MKIRVLIADDHPLLRQGVRQVLELEHDIVVVGEAADGGAVLQLERELAPDVVLLDVSMPKTNGVELARILKRHRPDLGVIILTVHSEEPYRTASLNAGVSSYLLKDVNPQHLIRAVRNAARGDTYMPCMQWSSPSGQHLWANHQLPLLTAREREVLLLVAEGMTNMEIAGMLYISEKTVKNHLSNIFEKLGVSDRTNAALLAVRSGLVTG